MKYDFASGQKVYSTYVYTGYTDDQIVELKQKVVSFFGAVQVIKELKINNYVEKIDKEYKTLKPVRILQNIEIFVKTVVCLEIIVCKKIERMEIRKLYKRHYFQTQ